MATPAERVDEGLVLRDDAVRVVVADRLRSGKWRLTLAVDASFTLPDGRTLRFVRDAVRVNGMQSGRKKNPATWTPGRKPANELATVSAEG